MVGLVLAQFIDGAAELLLRRSGFPKHWVTSLIGADRSGWRLLMFVGALPALPDVLRAHLRARERALATRGQHGAGLRGSRDIFAPGIRYKTILGTCLAGMALIGTWGSIAMGAAVGEQLAVGTDYATTAAAVHADLPRAIGAIIGTLVAAYLRRVVQPATELLRALPGVAGGLPVSVSAAADGDFDSVVRCFVVPVYWPAA